MSVETETRLITPQEALKILEKNTRNRNVRQTRVETYAADMAAGNWKENGVPIILNGKGGPHDGQHRLLACVRADKPFKTVVVSGVTDDAHKTIDTGMTRTMADELRWAGEEHTAELAAILNLLWKHDDGSLLDTRPVPSRTALAEYLKTHPDVRLSLGVSQVAKRTRVRGTALMAAHQLLLREHGQEIADRFGERLDQGTDYGPGDPCLALRNYAVNVAGTKVRPTTKEWFAICVKAANAWLLSREVVHLRWRRTGPQREGFPVIVTREEVGDLNVEEL